MKPAKKKTTRKAAAKAPPENSGNPNVLTYRWPGGSRVTRGIRVTLTSRPTVRLLAQCMTDIGTRLDALEAVHPPASLAADVGILRGQIENVNRHCVDTVNHLADRLTALEKQHPIASDFEVDGHDDSDHEHIKDAPEPTVAELCERHNLGFYGYEWRTRTGAKLDDMGTAPTLCVESDGAWYWYGDGRDSKPTAHGDRSTLAAALERYCPEPTDPAATPEERAKLCEAWGLEPAKGGDVYIAPIGNGDKLIIHKASGFASIQHPGPAIVDGTIEHDGSLADLEAVFRQHLPYYRDWREKAAVKEGWKLPEPNVSIYTPDGINNHGPWADTRYGDYAERDGSIRPAPDRAAWLAFLREHKAKEPTDLDRAKASIAELEAQLAKVRVAIGAIGGAA